MKHLRITVEGKTYDVEVEFLDEDVQESPKKTTTSAKLGTHALTAPVASTKPPTAKVTQGKGIIVSPLAALVVSVEIAIGDAVKEGQKVITLEAMKMNTTVTATTAGTVKAIHVSAGNAVEEGQPLIQLD